MEGPMVKSTLVRAMNEDYARLKLEASRIEELPIELEQLRKAMEAATAEAGAAEGEGKPEGKSEEK